MERISETINEKINSLDEWKVAVIVVLAAASIYAVLINGDPLVDIMEARNLISARECVEDGSCLVTTMNGAIRVRKPPVPTWLAAAAMKVSGDVTNVYAARAPVIPLIALLALSVYLFSRRWLDRYESLTAALVAVTFVIMCNEGRRITWDVSTVAFAFAGVWALFNALDRSKPAAPWILSAGLFWALSILSKGPLTPYAVLCPFLLTLMLSERRWEYRWWVVPVVALIAAPLSLSWWLYIYNLHPEALFKIKGEAGTWTSFRELDLFLYLKYLPAYVFPWTAAVIGTFLIPFMKAKDGSPLITDERRRLLLFFLIWFGISLLLLTIAPKKKVRYVMTIILPLSIGVSIFLSEMRSSGPERFPRIFRVLWKVQTYQLPLIAALLLGVIFYDLIFLGGPWFMILIVPFIALLAFKVLRDRGSVDSVIVGTVVIVFLMTVTGAVGARDYLNKNPRHDLAGAARVAEITSGEKLYFFGNKRKDRVVWITRRKNIHITAKSRIKKPPPNVLIEERHVEDFMRWAAARGFSYTEVYSFRYKSMYTLFKHAGAATEDAGG